VSEASPKLQLFDSPGIEAVYHSCTYLLCVRVISVLRERGTMMLPSETACREQGKITKSNLPRSDARAEETTSAENQGVKRRKNGMDCTRGQTIHTTDEYFTLILMYTAYGFRETARENTADEPPKDILTTPRSFFRPCHSACIANHIAEPEI
jgi:hypothetical protein